MVLSERNSDPVRNGRRSRGPSPNSHGIGVGGSGGGAGGGVGSGATGNGAGSHNAHQSHSSAAGGASASTAGGPGHGTPESSDDDNSVKRNGKSKSKQSEYEEKIRVGRDYQAVCPPLINEVERKPELLNERALLVWSPTKDIPDMKLEEYIAVAKEKYGYNGEQALGMLFWHKHDLERAVLDLANFTPFPDEWTVEDKVLFEQAFQFHGKSFHRIRQMLPDKSIASLVKYYYSWKKTRHRSSAIDRHEKAIKTVIKEGSENGSEGGSNEESDVDEKLLINEHMGISVGGGGGNSHEFVKTDNENMIGAAGIGNSSAAHLMDTELSFVSGSHAAIGGGLTTFGGHIDGVMSVDGVGGSGVGVGVGIGADSNDDAALDGNKTSMNGLVNSNGVIIMATGGGNNSNNKNMGGGGSCKNCGVACHHLHITKHGPLCSSCHIHWRRTGNKRPTSGPYVGKRSRFGADRSKRKPPRGMYINHDDLLALAAATNTEDYLAEGDRKIASLLDEIQANKQKIELLDKECSEIKSNGDDVPTLEPQRITGRWTNDEMQLAAMFMGDHGKDFQAIAKLIGTKTEAHIRTFYINNRRRMNLDVIIKEHEVKQAAAEAANAANNVNADASNAVDTPVSVAAAAAATANAAGAVTVAGGTSASTSNMNDSGSGVDGNLLNTSVDSDVTFIENLDTSNENSSTTNVSAITTTATGSAATLNATTAAVTAAGSLTGANNNSSNNSSSSKNSNSALSGADRKNEATVALISSKQKGGGGGGGGSGDLTNVDKQDKITNNINNNSNIAASTSSAAAAAIGSNSNNSCSSSSLSNSSQNSNTASNNNNAVINIQGAGVSSVSGTASGAAAAIAASGATEGKKDKEKLVAATIAIIADESDTNTTTTSTSSSAELTTNASKSNTDGTTKTTSVGVGSSVNAQLIAHKRDNSTLQNKDDGHLQPATKKVALTVSNESLPIVADK